MPEDNSQDAKSPATKAGSKNKNAAKNAQPSREERLSAQLRANLKKRKDLTRQAKKSAD